MGWKGFFKGLGKAAKVAVPIAAVAVPGAGPIAATVMNAVMAAEQLHGAKKGPEKLQAVMATLRTAAPLIVASLEAELGVTVEESAFDEFLRLQTESYVQLLKGAGALGGPG